MSVRHVFAAALLVSVALVAAQDEMLDLTEEDHPDMYEDMAGMDDEFGYEGEYDESLFDEAAEEEEEPMIGLSPKQIDKAFEEFDEDVDGLLSPTELAHWLRADVETRKDEMDDEMRKQSSQTTEAEYQQSGTEFVREGDMDGDGGLSPQEFGDVMYAFDDYLINHN
ncbi:hypothetical protein DIPPA_06909 [Diplonema papillatum]|nr:hypothetical protein DIPPA_06909 [Diplonema papillatum]